MGPIRPAMVGGSIAVGVPVAFGGKKRNTYFSPVTGRQRSNLSRPCRKAGYVRSPGNPSCHPGRSLLPSSEFLQSLLMSARLPYTRRLKRKGPAGEVLYSRRSPAKVRVLKTRLTQAGIPYPGKEIRVPYV